MSHVFEPIVTLHSMQVENGIDSKYGLVKGRITDNEREVNPI